MQNIFLFFQKFKFFFFFLILQILCIAFLVQYNRSYEAAYSTVVNEYTTKIQELYTSFKYNFIDLKRINKHLEEENTLLRNKLSQVLEQHDSIAHTPNKMLIDSLLKDTSNHRVIQQFNYTSARVVNNSINQENNYITLSKGQKDGIEKGMAVTSPKGIVGIVVATSPNYSIVMSLMNRQSKTSAMLLANYKTGIVEWSGKQPNVVEMRNIPKIVPLKKGDTVVTSNISGNFPAGFIIGTISNIDKDNASSFYNLTVNTCVDFTSLQVVYVIKNQLIKEKQHLEKTFRETDPKNIEKTSL